MFVEKVVVIEVVRLRKDRISLNCCVALAEVQNGRV